MSNWDVHKYYKYCENKSMVACIFISAIFLFSVSPIGSNLFRLHPSSSNIKTEAKDELERALQSTSMDNKTLIITIVNKAYAKEDGVLDVFLQSLSLGEDTQHLVHHLLVVAVDQEALDRCRQLKLLCYRLSTDGVDFSGEEIYMSGEFISMMWRRTHFLIDVLRRGYNFIFTDTDVMWLKNPLPRLTNAKADLQFSCDRFNGRPWDISNPINTGFYFIKSSKKTISLFEQWYSQRNSTPGLKEQDVLQKMVLNNATTKMELKVRFLKTSLFGGFCQHNHNLAEVVTIHANCCRTIDAKIIDLRAVLEDYKRFKDAGFKATALPHGWVEHKACSKSWSK